MAEFFEAPNVLEILEAFEMQSQDVGRSLHPDRLVRFLRSSSSLRKFSLPPSIHPPLSSLKRFLHITRARHCAYVHARARAS